MAPHIWASDPQLAFLKSRLPNFVTAQAAGQLAAFWPNLQERWFHDFPEEVAQGLPLPNALGDAPALTMHQMEALGAAIKRRKSMLQNWFRNQSKKIRHGGTSEAQVVSPLSCFFKSQKKTRPHHVIELYQMKTQYKPKIEAALRRAGYFSIGERPDENEQDNWVDESDGSAMAALKSLQSERMRVRTRVVKALFDAEPANERDALKAETEGEKVKMALEKAIPEENTPRSYQQSIDQLADFYGEVHKVTQEKAGWVGFTITGGPHPRLNGQLSMKIICFGTSPAGNNFEEAHEDFSGAVTLPFQAFLRRLFPQDVRRARALDPEDSLADEAEPAPEEPQSKKSKPRKSKKKSKKAQPSVPTDALPDIALAAADTLPGIPLAAGEPPLASFSAHTSPTAAPSSPATASSSMTSSAAAAMGDLPLYFTAEELARLSALEDGLLDLIGSPQGNESGASELGFGDEGGEMDMHGDMPMPEWASDFDPAMLTGEEVGMPTPTQGAAVEASPTPSRPVPQIRSMGAGPGVSAAYAPPSHLFEAFRKDSPGNAAPSAPSITTQQSVAPSFNVTPPQSGSASSAPAATTTRTLSFAPQPAGSADTAPRTFSFGPQLPGSVSSAAGTAPRTFSFVLQPPLTAAFFAPVATTSPAPTTPLAYTLPRPPPTTASSRTNALGQTARIPMMAKDIVLTVLAAPQAASGSQASIAPPIGAPAVTPTPSSTISPFASPRKSTERAPPAKKPAKGVSKGKAVTTGESAAPTAVFTTTNNNRAFNLQKDVEMAQRKAVKGAQRERLRNPSGGADLVVVPLPPRERKRKELGDGSIAVLPRKRTRKELDEERVEALMLARRDPNKVREPEKTVGKGSGVSKGAAGKRTSGGVKKKAAAAAAATTTRRKRA
ncbi:hypothetical protein C8J57DRAFT_1732365 [Mycena rebaudengoi]|nr:hypothetical protein C8J57DRAFT_1732365 [Mycena rebaudengoi]